MATISRKGTGVYAKDHKYVVFHCRKCNTLAYIIVYDHEDTDFGLLADLARKVVVHEGTTDYIGQGTFTLSAPQIGAERVLTFFYNRSQREESAHYLDALRDEVRQALADAFGVSVQIQFDLRAISTPQVKTVVHPEKVGK